MIQDLTIPLAAIGSSLVLLLLMNIVGGIFLARTKQNPEKFKHMSVVMKTAAFVIFLVIGFSLIPVMVKLFTDALPDIIKDSPLPQMLKENAMTVIYVVWIIMAIGLAVAFPAMKKSGFFDPELPEQSY